jgi:hypothetical protein
MTMYIKSSYSRCTVLFLLQNNIETGGLTDVDCSRKNKNVVQRLWLCPLLYHFKNGKEALVRVPSQALMVSLPLTIDDPITLSFHCIYTLLVYVNISGIFREHTHYIKQ